MIESLPSALFVCDAATLTVVEHNAAARAFVEEVLAPPRPLQSLIGREASELFPDFSRTLEPLFRRAIASEETCSADELRVDDRFVAVTAQPMFVAAEVVYLMVSLSEVTEKVSDRERQQYLQRMESVGALAGGLAHDVNNMLFAIGGHAYLLRARSDMSPQALEELDRIDAAIACARTLTAKLLTFARGGSPERGLVQLNDVVGETLRILSGSLGEVGVQLSLDPSLPPLLADSGGLQQILMNFCVN